MGTSAGRALVVGASAGIGRAAALRLGELGFEVAVVGRRQARLDEVVASIGGHAIVADVSDPGQCRALVEEAVDVLGGIDLVVHAASTSQLKLLADSGADYWTEVLHTNVVAPALVAAAAVPHLAAGAVLCLLSSESVGQPYPGIVPYVVSKAALEELARGIRAEHPEIRVCCLQVGATNDTEFGRDFDMELGAALFPRWIALGKLPAQFMNAAELGGAIADTMALAVRSPGLDLQTLVIRAPGGPMLAGLDGLLDQLAEQQDAAQA